MSGDPLRDFFAVGPAPATAYDRFFHGSSALAAPHCLGSLYQPHASASAASRPPRGVQRLPSVAPAQLAPNSAENPIDLTVRKRRAKDCAVAGCARAAKAKGLCLRHQAPRCAVRGCMEPAARGAAQRRCKNHSARKRCGFSGCKKITNAKKSFCKAHDGQRCRQEACDARVSESNGVCSRHAETTPEFQQEEGGDDAAAELQARGHSPAREGAGESAVDGSKASGSPRNAATNGEVDSGRSPHKGSAHGAEQALEAAASKSRQSERPQTPSPAVAVAGGATP